MTTGLFRQVTEPGLSERAIRLTPSSFFLKEEAWKEELIMKNIPGVCPGIFFVHCRLFLGFFLFGLSEDGRKEENQGKNGGDYSCFGGFGPKIVLEF